MAEFCKQCSIEIFGADYGDFVGISIEEATKAGLYPIVLCEHCGPCQVDHEGTCVSPDCYEKHGKDPRA